MGIENRKCDVSFVLPCLQEGSHDIRHVIPTFVDVNYKNRISCHSMAMSNSIDILYVEIILVKVAYFQDSNRPLCCPRSALSESPVTVLAITWHLFLSDSCPSPSHPPCLACPSNSPSLSIF